MPAPGIAGRGALTVALSFYTVYAVGPMIWLAMMSLRTTQEINLDHYGLPQVLHWWKFQAAWVNSNYGTYFWNSVWVVVASVTAVTLIGAMAAYCLARYRFPGNRAVLLAIFSSIILPPQITIISLFQVMVEYRLFNTLTGLILVYIGTQLPLTVYLLESFFSRIPQDLFDAAKIDGCSDLEMFRRIGVPIGAPAIVTTVILNFILLWNEFLYAVVLITDDGNRTLPLGIQKFIGDQFSDIGMVATGAMISIVPVILLYFVFSERIIQGMTAGAIK
ncbi:MAG: carbohydrate ABC transporter permease [Proteobacteria bacterium]|nr:carbohydrate ABC transporter permease [Pseudomonadota bacterium]MBI3496641.1 carbohydrate ABC transporter permease [Pseudomonadota bacterium]